MKNSLLVLENTHKTHHKKEHDINSIKINKNIKTQNTLYPIEQSIFRVPKFTSNS